MDVITEQTSAPARYVTLRDYLRVLRRYRLMIVIVGLVGAAAGLVYAGQQAPVYTAAAQVSFQDPTGDLGVVGLASSSVETPAQVAATEAALVTTPSVMQQVKHALGVPASAQALAGAVSAQVSATSGLLQVSATGSSSSFAASLANTVAKVVVSQANAQTRTQFTQLARTVKGEIARLRSAATPGRASELAFYADELGRLNTLAGFAGSAQLVAPAQLPGPSSPSRARSALLGLLFGLLLAIAAAFLRDSTDRRLRSAQEMRQSYELPVVGHIRSQAMGQVAQFSNGSSHAPTIDLEAFRILRRNLAALEGDRSPQSILVTSAVRGEGKTTVASSLAFAIAAAGRRTLLVDCDLRRPALAARLGIDESPGITDYLAGAVSPQDILRLVTLAEPRGSDDAAPASNGHAPAARAPQLVFIPSGSRTAKASELLGSYRFNEFIQQVSEAYEAVVFDSSPLLPVADTLEVLARVDAIVVCARASETTREQASAAREALSRFPKRPTGLVVTGIKPGGDDYDAYA